MYKKKKIFIPWVIRVSKNVNYEYQTHFYIRFELIKHPLDGVHETLKTSMHFG